jgi:hypothetical protein
MAVHKPAAAGCRLPAAVCIAIVIYACGGCAARQKAALQAPDAQVSLSHFTGGALSGPTTQVADSSRAETAIAATVKLVALEQPLPADLLKPIDPDVRLIVSDRDPASVAPVLRLTRGSRWTANGEQVGQLESKLSSGALGRAADMGVTELAVPPGATAVVRALDSKATNADSLRGVELLFRAEPSPAHHQLQLSLAIEDGPNGRELAVLKSIAVGGSTNMALAIPFRYSDGRTQTVVALIQASPADDSPGVQAALARCAADLATSASAATERPTTLALNTAAWPSYQAALQAMDEPGFRRASLIYLATETGAEVCEDCALVADDAALAQLAQQAHERVSATAAATQPTSESLGWTLDTAALSLMGQLQSDDKLPPELQSVLLRHAGQAALGVGAVQELLASAKGRSDFEQRVQAENLVALEDSSPAARVRAFDWLTARGKAPADYDPLGPPNQRRAALNKAMDEMAAQTAVPAAAGTGAQGGKP